MECSNAFQDETREQVSKEIEKTPDASDESKTEQKLDFRELPQRLITLFNLNEYEDCWRAGG